MIGKYGLLETTSDPAIRRVHASLAVDSSRISEYGNEGQDWVDLSVHYGGIGWLWDGSTLSAPPHVAQYRTLLTQSEWIQSWTESEWRTLKKAARGDLSPTPVPDGVSERLDHLFDSIRLTNSFDVKSDAADQFYQYLQDQGFIDQARRDELQQGILE